MGLEVGVRGCVKDLDMSRTWGLSKELQSYSEVPSPNDQDGYVTEDGPGEPVLDVSFEGTTRHPSPALKTQACRRENSQEPEMVMGGGRRWGRVCIMLDPRVNGRVLLTS